MAGTKSLKKGAGSIELGTVHTGEVIGANNMVAPMKDLPPWLMVLLQTIVNRLRSARFLKLLFVAFLSLFAPDVFSHGPGGHQGCSEGSGKSCTNTDNKAIKTPTVEFQAKIQEINKRYVEHVKPIFREKCGDCHSTQIRLPWYYPIPGVRQLIDHDHREAMKHLDISADFPFGGHGTPKKDLRAIQESIRKDSMPPFRYRALHRNSRLTAEEEKMVMDWAASGESLLAK